MKAYCKKAEDTVMSEVDIENHLDDDWDGLDVPSVIAFATEAQAKITWGKAIREVMRWTAREFGVDWSEEKEQLKEWGVDD